MAATSASASLSKELQDQLAELSKSVRVPVVVRKIIDAMAREISSLRSENDRLKLEVSALSSKSTANCVEQTVTEITAAEVPEKSPLSYEEVERLRSVIIGGVPELKSSNTRERVSYDFQSSCNVLDFLGVECNPVSVYRLGRPDQGHNRLLKVVLPARVFQRLAVIRAPRLRFFPGGSVFLRKSLTPEQRKRRREERNAGNVSRSSALPPDTGQVEPCTRPPTSFTARSNSCSGNSGN